MNYLSIYYHIFNISMNIMNIMNIITINKFNNNLKKRHVTLLFQLSFFSNIDDKFINNNTKHIINVKYINRKQVNVLLKYIKYKINVIPITYWMSNNEKLELLDCQINNNIITKQMIILDIENARFDNNYTCRYSCEKR